MMPIQTYVFLDLETTGLPREENNRTKIAELSMIAVKREHLLDTAKGKSPRVQNKLTLCFNPCKLMQEEGSKITGLDNFLLEHEMKFDKYSFSLIDTFLCLLTQPICLIAHNGNNFDYPILKNNMEKVNVSFSCDIKCADSYFALYTILENQKNNIRIYNEHTPKLYSGVSNILKNGPSIKQDSKVRRKLENDFKSRIINTDSQSTDNGAGFESTDKAKSEETMNSISNARSTSTVAKTKLNHIDDVTIGDLTLNQLQSKQKVSNSNHKYNGSPVSGKEATATKNNCQSDVLSENLDIDFLGDDQDIFENNPKTIQKANESTPKRKIMSNVNDYPKKKVLKGFPWKKYSRPEESYKLCEIYRRQLNREPPEAHRAENDCIMAMEIAVTVVKEFVEWVDEFHNDFEDIEAMKIGVKLQ